VAKKALQMRIMRMGDMGKDRGIGEWKTEKSTYA